MNLQEMTPKAAQAAGFLKALANRHRLMILCELHKGETSVSPLQQALGLNQSSLSQHLARLRADGLVKTRRESQVIHYSLADEKVTRMIALLYALFCAKECASERDEPRRKIERRGTAALKPRKGKGRLS